MIHPYRISPRPGLEDGGTFPWHLTGSRDEKGQTLATIPDLHIPRERAITAPNEGLIIGITNNPLVHRGDPLIHLAREVG
jgi:predicted deacylase